MKNPFSLEGRTALVTGANRGLGRAFADAIADAGADVVVVGRAASMSDARVQVMRHLSPRSRSRIGGGPRVRI